MPFERGEILFSKHFMDIMNGSYAQTHFPCKLWDAGEKVELHGSVYRNYCMKCHRFYDFAHMKASTGVPRCECGGIIKPDVVLYEEGLDNQTINEAVKAISEAQVLIIGGTSLAVYPAAGLIDYFRGEHLVVINKSPTPRDRYADLLIQEPIGQVFSQIHC